MLIPDFAGAVLRPASPRGEDRTEAGSTATPRWTRSGELLDLADSYDLRATGRPATGGGGSCASAWVSNQAYTAGNEVSYNGDNWTASQWNYDEVPGGPSGAWNNDGAC